MKYAFAGALLLLCVAGSEAWAQGNSPSFEVASVKLNPNPSRTPVHFGRDSVNLISVDLRVVLMLAYGVRDFQIQGPDWLRDLNGAHRFNVEAKAPHPVPGHQLSLMLRTLLAERFHLTLHHEEREMPVIAMRPARSGAKVTPTVGVPPDTQWIGLKGRFDFAPPPRLPPQPPDAPAMTDEDRLAGCDLNAQRSVGMTLKRAKAVVDILVIDHADKVPAED